MLKLLGLMFFMLGCSQTYAIFLSSYIYEIGSEQDFIAKPVQNDTTNSNSYKVTTFKIDKPGVGGENVIYSPQRELIFSPLLLNIPANSTDYFKLVYIGPKDDQERYYRVNFLESMLNAFDADKSTEKSTGYLPSISLSSILIVRPRQQNLKYELNEQQGYIKNTGNTFFKVIIAQGCAGTEEESNQFYMLPGEEYRDPSLQLENRKLIVANKAFIPIGTKCKDQ